MRHSISDKIFLFMPTIGILGFFTLYVVSTYYYPGGSYANRNYTGFSWLHNYWCNLLERIALNGEINPARNIAISATASLCIGVGYFYYIFPRYFAMRKIWRIFVRLVGILSMCFAIFLFTEYHDFVLNMAGILGGAAFVGTLVALRRNKSFTMLWIGAFCFCLIGVNNYIYYTHVFIEYLPLIQKVSLIIVLTWFMHLNWVFYKLAKRN